ncbi:hypothetical protein J6590_072927 [Homalodisca vitripennis]|nr:hypothetical protein J6590_072927 [Homalodisca vitripennis]
MTQNKHPATQVNLMMRRKSLHCAILHREPAFVSLTQSQPLLDVCGDIKPIVSKECHLARKLKEM